MIAPMLLMPLVENSFKHGLSKQRKDVWINMELSEDAGGLTFIVENTKPDNNITINDGDKGGIGLENMRKRLKLIYHDLWYLNTYPGRDSYKVELKINYK
jgi:sensor histidine kinase YesM